jgi:hypothetical protein
MTTPELEQVLAATLHSHAEEAMTKTDTRSEHERLDERLAEEGPRRHRLVVGGALLAAAVTAAAVWAADPDLSGTAPDPVGPSTGQTASERVADDFFAAFAAGDADLAASYVDRSEVRWSEWESHMRLNEAWHVEYLPQPCEELSTSSASTPVVCAFDYHAQGSDELGFGPFGMNAFNLRISDGQVVHAEATYNADNNGQAELFKAIGAWVRENHPGDWKSMTAGQPPQVSDRWYRLWERRIDEYVAEQLNGE